MVSLGGRIAGVLIFDDVTTGASQDITSGDGSERRDMVTKYGFSEALGMINYCPSADEVFIGRRLWTYAAVPSAKETAAG